jgi:hypothetical protein
VRRKEEIDERHDAAAEEAGPAFLLSALDKF